jgi:hypothetical protein
MQNLAEGRSIFPGYWGGGSPVSGMSGNYRNCYAIVRES